MSPLLGDVDLRVAGATPEKLMHQGVQVWPGAGEPPPPPISTPDTDFWYTFNGGTIGARMDPADPYGSEPWSSLGWPYPRYRTEPTFNRTVAEIDAGASLTSIMQRNGPAVSWRSWGFWVKIAQAPTGDTRLCDLRNTSTGGTVGGLLLRSDMTLRFMQGSSGVSAYTSPPLTPGKWYWIAEAIACDPALAHFAVWSEDDLVTPIYNPSAWAITTSYTAPTTLRFGRVTTAGDIGLTQFADILVNDGSFDLIPPWNPNASAPEDQPYYFEIFEPYRDGSASPEIYVAKPSAVPSLAATMLPDNKTLEITWDQSTTTHIFSAMGFVYIGSYSDTYDHPNAGEPYSKFAGMYCGVKDRTLPVDVLDGDGRLQMFWLNDAEGDMQEVDGFWDVYPGNGAPIEEYFDFNIFPPLFGTSPGPGAWQIGLTFKTNFTIPAGKITLVEPYGYYIEG